MSRRMPVRPVTLRVAEVPEQFPEGGRAAAQVADDVVPMCQGSLRAGTDSLAATKG